MRNNLIAARKSAGFTQEKLAGMAGITTRHYQDVEYGKKKASVEVWDRIEDLLGISHRILMINDTTSNEKSKEKIPCQPVQAVPHKLHREVKHG